MEPTDTKDYTKATPLEVLVKFGMHKFATGKCLVERDALKLCVILHDKK